MDARTIFPEQTFLGALAAGVHIAHIADAVRLGAVAGSSGGWMIDCDTWFVNDLTTIPTHTGHAFGSQGAKARRADDSRYWRLNYVRAPYERAYLASPWHFPKDSPVLSGLVSFCTSLLEGKKTKA